MTTPTVRSTAVGGDQPAPSVARLRAVELTRQVRGRTLVDAVSLDVAPGELVALVGGSGAGKTSLLETLVGVKAPTSGSVLVDGDVGLVPQDDIIHLDLPLRATVRYAARLRLPGSAGRAELDAVVDRVLADLDLTDHGHLSVRQLSGGQRKRAGIAVELLTRPAVLALDEPTSGLDPATAREVLLVLRRLADAGTAVLLTTHSPDDVLRCDRVVVLATGGRAVFDGPPSAAPAHFGVTDLTAVYAALAALPPPPPPATRPAGPAPRRRVPPTRPDAPAWLRQLITLVHRSADLMVRNRLTAAILLGSPALVVAMLTILFRSGTVTDDPVAGVQLAYWIAFAGFFFGLTYGLLQIVTESAVLRRETSWGLSPSAYVMSKVVVLMPLLVAVDVVLFALLRTTDRLPSAGSGTWAALGGVFLLGAAAALALGLLASALVSSPAQATLALPMLCFPQVLFAGAMVPVDGMTGGGAAVSLGTSGRWGFEATARLLALDGHGAGAAPWAGAVSGGVGTQVVVLAAMTSAALVATVAVLARRCSAR